MEKRRSYSPEFKVRVVMELITGQKGLIEASQEYKVKDHVLSLWKQEFLERAPQVFEQPKTENRKQLDRIAELEQMIGRLAMQLDIAKKVLRSSGYQREENDDL